MKLPFPLFFIFISVPVVVRSNGATPIAKVINVNLKGGEDFTSIQQAIDSVPLNNNQWTKIHVAAGAYREKVNIDASKRFIILEGEGAKRTSIEWGDFANDPKNHDTLTSATFTSRADNFVAKDITFKNTYNPEHGTAQAVAALVAGDKSSFYNCSFMSIQDTLFDAIGRHYFHGCYIEGFVDFIFGTGQSIYEVCTIFVQRSTQPGYITAQGRLSPNDQDAFVFKNCIVTGAGEAYLGRAWKTFARVIFYKTYMWNIVVPLGWDAWDQKDKVQDITYVEADNTGPGSNTSGRVTWMKFLNGTELGAFTNISYINSDGWLGAQPQV